MSRHKDLQKAIRQMADGSKSGFHTFYLGSVQYVYSSALLLHGDHKSACGFMVDFYQYLYLHLPEYTPGQDLEKWISRLIMDRFSQLSIGKNRKNPSVREQMSAGNVQLEASERERIWRLLEERMHFPKEAPKKRGGSRILLLFTVLLAAALLIWHYREPLTEKLREFIPTEKDEEASDADAEDGADIGEDFPDDLMEGMHSETFVSGEEALPGLNGSESSGNVPAASAPVEPTVDTPTVDTPTPIAPTAPDVDTPTPTAPTAPDVDTPTVGQPTANSPISEQDSSLGTAGSGSLTDLEDYELDLYYGDSLTQP